MLELLRFGDERGLERPTVRVAQWFYRLRLATRDCPTESVVGFAEMLVLGEYGQTRLSGTIEVTDLDLLLAYMTGRPSPAAVKRIKSLGERLRLTLTLPGSAPITAPAGVLQDALEERIKEERIKEEGLEGDPASMSMRAEGEKRAREISGEPTPKENTTTAADGRAAGRRTAHKEGQRKT